jgi:hypothetical protein
LRIRTSAWSHDRAKESGGCGCDKYLFFDHRSDYVGALGANQAMISDYAGIHERLPRITVFSMTTQFRPIRILPPSSATIRAPCKNAGTGAENYNSAKEWHPVRPTPRSQSLDVCQNAQLT